MTFTLIDARHDHGAGGALAAHGDAVPIAKRESILYRFNASGDAFAKTGVELPSGGARLSASGTSPVQRLFPGIKDFFCARRRAGRNLPSPMLTLPGAGTGDFWRNWTKDGSALSRCTRMPPKGTCPSAWRNAPGATRWMLRLLRTDASERPGAGDRGNNYSRDRVSMRGVRDPHRLAAFLGDPASAAPGSRMPPLDVGPVDIRVVLAAHRPLPVP